MSSKTLDINIFYKPYLLQKQVHNSKAKYRMVCVGRRSGKTYLACAELIKLMRTTRRPLKIGWIAPSHGVAQRGLDTFKQIGRELIAHGICKIRNAFPSTITMNKHVCTFLSAENPNAIRGYYFDLIIIDEAAFIDDDVFNKVIRPLLMDTDGQLLAITTPKGKKGWFYKLFKLAETVDHIDSFHWSTYDNPYIKDSIVDEEKKEMPTDVFRQEILAQFIDVDNQVFEDVTQCFNREPCKCDCQSIVGVDLARKVDDTVFASLCPKCNKIRDLQVYHGIPWMEQEAKIVSYFKKQNARIIMMDGTGLGDVVQQHLQQENIRFEAIIMSAPKKMKIYNDLISKIEQGLIQWDDKKYPEIEKQFLSLEREVKKRTISYDAATGEKDDICDGIGLALHGMLHFRESFIMALGDLEEEEPDEFYEDDEEW